MITNYTNEMGQAEICFGTGPVEMGTDKMRWGEYGVKVTGLVGMGAKGMETGGNGENAVHMHSRKYNTVSHILFFAKHVTKTLRWIKRQMLIMLNDLALPLIFITMSLPLRITFISRGDILPCSRREYCIDHRQLTPRVTRQIITHMWPWHKFELKVVKTLTRDSHLKSSLRPVQISLKITISTTCLLYSLSANCDTSSLTVHRSVTAMLDSVQRRMSIFVIQFG